MGGASSGAFRNPLAGLGVPAVDLVAREVLQNSVDAALLPDRPVRVEFRRRHLDASEWASLKPLLGFEEGSRVFEREDLVPKGSLADLTADPLDVLYVEDFGTTGLGGTVHPVASTDADNYRRLCLQVGSTRETQDSGGSFGYGKAVYWAISRLWTVVFYSRFQPTERTAGDWARVVSVSWFKKHRWRPAGASDELEYTGRAFRGLVSEDGTGCFPVVNEEAQILAEQLGFTVRAEEDTGTSAMVLGSELNMAGLPDGIEKHWWPRLLEDRLSVKIEGERQPAPRALSHLKPFIRCWELLREQREPEEEEELRPLSYNRRPLGTVALTTHDEEEEVPSERRRVEIALVRGPEMVVQYHRATFLTPSQPMAVGVFKADSSMETVLTASEPPAHDRWDPSTTRTDRPLEDSDRTRIKKIFEKVGATSREFVRRHQEPPKEAPPRCHQLEKLLGAFFATKPTGKEPPPRRKKDPFRIHYSEPVQRVLVNGTAALDATVTVSVSEEAFEGGVEIMVCRLTAWVDLLQDEGSVGDRIPMAYMAAKDPKDGEVILAEPGGTESTIEALFTRDESSFVVELRSMNLPDPEYRTRFNFRVERV